MKMGIRGAFGALAACTILAVALAEQSHHVVRRATSPTEAFSGCGTTKGCYLSPEGCSDTNCDYIVTFTQTDTYTDFEVSAKVSGSNVYVAIGFSNDARMGDDSVVDCISYGDTVTIQMSRNSGYDNNRLTDPTDGLDTGLSSGALANDFLTCNFRRLNMVAGNSDIFDITSPNTYHLLIALGTATSATGKMKHATRLASASAIDFSETGAHGGVLLDAKVKAHGAMMIIAWAFLAGFGLLNARFYKPEWPKRKLCGVAMWFNNHRFAMVTVMVLTVASFILIFVKVGGFTDTSGESITLLKAHPYLGIVVTALVIINPFMALFRCDKTAPNRWVFNWFHRMVGQIAFALGVLNICLGLELQQTGAISSDWMLWLMVAYGIFHIVTELILVCLSCVKRKQTETSMEMKAPGEENAPSAGGQSCMTPQSVILMIYTLVSLALMLAVVIGIILA